MAAPRAVASGSLDVAGSTTGPHEMPDSPSTHRRVTRDVAATLVAFTATGAVVGTWFSRTPAVRDHLHANLRTLGLVMVCFGIGSLLSMPFAGRLIQRFSARRVCTVGSLCASMSLPVLAEVSNPVPFAGVLLLTGAFYGLWSVTLSVHGAEVEAHFGKTIMPMFYGALSGGIILGTSSGALLAGAGVGLLVHFSTVVPALMVVILLAVPFWNDWHRMQPTAVPDMATVAEGRTGAAERGSGGRIVRHSALTLPILLIGVLLFCCSLAEGATSDWLAIHAHDDKGMSESLAATVLATFSAAEMVGRFTGGRVIDRIGRVWTLRGCGLVAAGGVAATILLPGFGVFLGALLWGLGLSVVQPMTMTAAGDIGGVNAPRAVATVSAMGVCAFLVGAPAMGLLAQRFSLGSALWTIVGLALAVTMLAGAAAPPQAQDVGPTAR